MSWRRCEPRCRLDAPTNRTGRLFSAAARGTATLVGLTLRRTSRQLRKNHRWNLRGVHKFVCESSLGPNDRQSASRTVEPGAMACNVPRHSWHLRQRRSFGIYELQILKKLRGFESVRIPPSPPNNQTAAARRLRRAIASGRAGPSVVVEAAVPVAGARKMSGGCITRRTLS